MKDLPGRLRALAENLPGLEYVLPLRSAEVCLEAADALETLQRDHEAMEVIRTLGQISVRSWIVGARTKYEVDTTHGPVYADDPAEAILKAAGKE